MKSAAKPGQKYPVHSDLPPFRFKTGRNDNAFVFCDGYIYMLTIIYTDSRYAAQPTHITFRLNGCNAYGIFTEDKDNIFDVFIEAKEQHFRYTC